MIKKIKTIILSRFKSNKEKWVEARRLICLGCEYNSLYVSSPRGYRFFLTTASRAYSWITGRLKDDKLSNCTACSMCSIYFKTAEKEEICPKGKWEIIK
jgi:hypothetical protein